MHYLKNLPLILAATAIASATTPASASTNSNLPAEYKQNSPHALSESRLQYTIEESYSTAAIYITTTTPAASSASTSTSIVSKTTTTVTSIKARSTPGSEDDSSDFTDAAGFEEGHPIKAFSGLASNNEFKQNIEESASSLLSANGWSALLGLSLVVVLQCH
ncbi:unnamed protein product [Penicillium bialowiezense]